MFHINKQKAIEKASGEWILQLDADEELSKELKKEIASLIHDSQNKNVVAYNIPRKNFFLGRFLMKGGQYPDYTIRLYRNGYAKFPCKSVHENVEIINPKQYQNSKNIGYLKNPILHYADKEFSRYYKRWQRYILLDAEGLNYKSTFINYIFIKPISTFFSMYIRHKGFMDGWQGFVFAFFSSVRFIVIFFKSLP
jgi:glycosyltransferase involved in cell wall biosynthesis